MNKIAWTGERLVPGVSGDVVVAHLHRYGFANLLAKDKRVLDIACGEGYGAKILSQSAASVVGVDLSAEVITYAQNKYGDNKLRFVQGSADRIPLNDSSVDLVVSFETLEHHDRHSEMLAEIKRVLTPEGTLIISTPDKLNYSEKRNYNNPFHVKELYFDQFQALISSFFSHSQIYQQATSLYSLIIPHEKPTQTFMEFHGDFEQIKNSLGPISPLFNIIIASMHEPANLGLSAFQGQEQLRALSHQHEERIKAVYRSMSYRIGSAFVKPYRLFFPKR